MDFIYAGEQHKLLFLLYLSLLWWYKICCARYAVTWL